MKKRKLVYGVGINDADYSIATSELIDGKWKITWRCPFYVKWTSMLMRSYQVKHKIRFPTYKECSVVSEWHYFMTFRAWMIQQDWEGKLLDKDLLVPGNKVYGPDTCVFLEERVNCFLLESGSIRGELPIGVRRCGDYDRFAARVKYKGKMKSLGSFGTPEEAHQAWLTFKLEQAKILASQQTDPRVAAALIDRYENYSTYFGDK